jgi:death on curing protein
MTQRIDAEDLLAFIGESTAPRTRVRDVSILFSAAARPDSAVVKKRTFESVPEQTAALLHAIIRWEPLDMWNASFGWAAARFFAETSGADLAVSPLDRMILTCEIQDGRMNEVAEIAKRIEPYMRTG